MDKRHRYGIMVDTETIGDLSAPIAYDIGWQVIDSHGRTYATRSFTVREIFNGRRDEMRTAYYANKIPSYIEDMRNGVRQMASIWEIYDAMNKDIREYNCCFLCAHNARFDRMSLNNTIRDLSDGRVRYFTPRLEWWDTMKMAQSVILKMPTYRKFCEANGYFTANNQMRKTAEILYRFISEDNEFEEEHKGAEDVEIERQILAYCKRQHKPMVKKLFKD